MSTLQQAFQALCNASAGAVVAAYTVPAATTTSAGGCILPPSAELHYLKSWSGCNAVMDVLDLCQGTQPIYTNLGGWGFTTHWLRVLNDRRLVLFRPDGTYSSQRTWHSASVEMEVSDEIIMAPNRPPIRGGVASLYSPKTILRGGLYNEAQAMNRGEWACAGHAKGLQRALRYYQLAAYALAGRANRQSKLGKMVGSILVSDSGQILAWGVNNGLFRHAELNLIRAWHRHHRRPQLFPDKSMLFSTLTPCEQCAGAIVDAMPASCAVYYGQDDPGPVGSVGRAMSNALDDVAPKRLKIGFKQGAQTFWGERPLADQIQIAMSAADAEPGLTSDDQDALPRAAATTWFERAEIELIRKWKKTRPLQNSQMQTDQLLQAEHTVKRDALGHIVNFLSITDFREQQWSG